MGSLSYTIIKILKVKGKKKTHYNNIQLSSMIQVFKDTDLFIISKI